MSAAIKPHRTLSLKVDWELLHLIRVLHAIALRFTFVVPFEKKSCKSRALVCAPAKGEKEMRERQVIRLCLIALAST